MTPQEIKQSSIREYLKDLGILPVKEYSNYGLYYSPYREDNSASFKVDYDKNLWIDYGTGEGGSIIDLVMKMENCSFHEVANRLERNPVNVHISSNAEAGRKATELIQSIHSTVYNRSKNYTEYKDLNDYLCGKKLAVKPEVIKKKSGIKI